MENFLQFNAAMDTDVNSAVLASQDPGGILFAAYGGCSLHAGTYHQVHANYVLSMFTMGPSLPNLSEMKVKTKLISIHL